jgi:urease accessory protein UreH
MTSPFPKSSSVGGEGLIVATLLPSGISGLEAMTFQYPLKLITAMRPPDTTSALVFLLTYGGGLVGGDRVSLAIEVRPGARLSLATQGHTKIFKSPSPGVVTRQLMRVDIASGAGLCLLPDPVQPFADSVYEQVQIFRLARGASLCLLDWVTQGRRAFGEDWSLMRWTGRNEVWLSTEENGEERKEKDKTEYGPGIVRKGDRLLVRDSVVLDSRRAHPQLPTLRESMHGLGVTGTLVLRGPLVKALGDFFLAEFTALPRLGARDWRTEAEVKRTKQETLSPREEWRAERLQMEKECRVLWTAANVRGCVVVKFGAPEFEDARSWIRSMLVEEGSIAQHFGQQALLCVR